MKLTAVYLEQKPQVLLEHEQAWLNLSLLMHETTSATNVISFLQSEEFLTVLERQDLTPYLIQDISAYQPAPVIPNPSKILAIGLNYKDHAEETDLFSSTDFPEVFTKLPNTLNHHQAPIPGVSVDHHYDYEGELVIVIGQKTRAVSEDEAQQAIFGYTIGNDFTARVPQFQTSQWILGKNMDGFAPVGPYIVSRDDFDFDKAELVTKVNGETRQEASLSQMIFKPQAIVSYLSQYLTLEPGDLIFTGTPSGVILGNPPSEQTWLTDGDRIDITISGLGTLSNHLAIPASRN